jgi:hypothetical protein
MHIIIKVCLALPQKQNINYQPLSKKKGSLTIYKYLLFSNPHNIISIQFNIQIIGYMLNNKHNYSGPMGLN